MNLVETLDRELRQVHLTDFEKARYIYRRCCEIFSFDARWDYAPFLGDKKLYNEIRNKKFDIENIDSRLVICHSFSKHIMKRLIDELTCLDCDVHLGSGHSWAYINGNGCFGKEWELDATLGDLARVKLNVPTRGFKCGYAEYDELIKDIDMSLGYFDISEEDYVKRMSALTYTETNENIIPIIEDSNIKYHFSDIKYFFDKIVGDYCGNHVTYFDEDYNFHELIDVGGEYSFFELSKHDDEYRMKKIRPAEYKVLTKTLYTQQ